MCVFVCVYVGVCARVREREIKRGVYNPTHLLLAPYGPAPSLQARATVSLLREETSGCIIWQHTPEPSHSVAWLTLFTIKQNLSQHQKASEKAEMYANSDKKTKDWFLKPERL